MTHSLLPEGEQRWSELDCRSLAIFRMVLGLILLLDIWGRLAHITDFYTDSGVFPRLLFSRSEFADDWLCFHLGIGDWWGQFALLFLQQALALGLMLGWRVRWMILGTWFLLNSLHLRNPFVNDRGDLELVLLLFWGYFLPLGAKWSLDAKAGRTQGSSARGVAAAGLILQIALIYLCAGLMKYGEFWLLRGDGLFHSLQSPLFAAGLASVLSQAPPLLLKCANYAVIAGELFLGFLLLCPVSVPLLRSIAVVLLLCLHLTIFALFNLGLFPLIGMLVALALLPSDFWRIKWFERLESNLDAKFGARASLQSDLGLAAKLFLLLAILLVLLSNAANRPEGVAFERPPVIVNLTDCLRLEQHWDLFSPLPPYNGHFEILRVSEPQQRIQAFPELRGLAESQSFPSHRWRMLMIASLFSRAELVRPGLSQRLLKSVPSTGMDYRYQFRVRLLGTEGEQLPETTWILWQGKH